MRDHPCVVADLEVGTKAIKVVAPGFQPAESNESIEGGKEKVLTVPIEPSGAVAAAPTSAQPAPAGATGLKIGGTDGEKGVKVFVDGAEKGVLPFELKDITPGKHTIRFDSPNYDKNEQTIEVTAGQVKDLGDVKLKVLKGQVTLDLVTQGATVTMVRRGDKKMEKKVTEFGRPIAIDTSENWRVVATKKGYDDFTQDLTFEDGQAEKTIEGRALRDRQAGPCRRQRPWPGSGPKPAAGEARAGALQRVGQRDAQHQLHPGLEGRPRRQAPRQHAQDRRQRLRRLAHGHLHPPGHGQADGHRECRRRPDQDGGGQVPLARRVASPCLRAGLWSAP